MAIQVLRDPRRYVLAVMALALIVVLPLMFAFVTMLDILFQPGSSTGSIVLWTLLGVAVTGLLVLLMVILARSTRQAESERQSLDSGNHSAS
jgi:hypothetical protein